MEALSEWRQGEAATGLQRALGWGCLSHGRPTEPQQGFSTWRHITCDSLQGAKAPIQRVIFLCNSISHSCGSHLVLGLLTGQDISREVKESLIRKRPSCLWWRLSYFIKGLSLHSRLLPIFSAWLEKPVI